MAEMVIRTSSPPLWSDDEGPNSFDYSLAKACSYGDVNLAHRIYSTWLAQQTPNPVTGLIDNSYLNINEAAAEAINGDHPTCLAYLCQQGYKVCVTFARSVACRASVMKSTACLEVFLAHGWDINAADSNVDPPLMGEFVEDQDLVCWFLDHGALPNATASKRDITPLSHACHRGSLETIKLMFQRGGSTARGELLNMASQRTDNDAVPILQYLFDHGDTKVNDTWREHEFKTDIYAGDNNAAPLHHAARVGNIYTVAWLLDHGADPLRRSKCIVGCGTTPLDSAVFMKHKEIEELLLEATEIMYGSRDPPVFIPDPLPGLREKDQLLFLESQDGIRCIPQENGRSVGQYSPIQDYSFYLMLLEQENKRKINKEPEEYVISVEKEKQPVEILMGEWDAQGFDFDAFLKETL